MEESLMNILLQITNKLKTLMENASKIVIEQSTLTDAEVLKSKLQTCLQRLEKELNNYFRLVTEPNTEEVSNISSIQLEAEDVLCELSIKIKELTPSLKHQSPALSSKLPKLELPVFDGNILEWHQFFDQFQTNIVNKNLADVDKFLYLKASLKGEAMKTIAGLDTTNKNYSIAMQILKDRYGKHNQIVDAHYSSLYKIEPAIERDIESCRKTLTQLETHLRVLQSLGENVNHNHLRFLVMEKFPEDIICEIKMKTKEESIDEIRECLRTIITAREDANRLTKNNNFKINNYTTETLHITENTRKHIANKGSGEQRLDNGGFVGNNRFKNEYYKKNIGNQFSQKRRYYQQDHSTARRNRNDEGPAQKQARFQCRFCSGSHYNDECTKVKTAAERKNILKNECFSCFSENHFSKNCHNKRPCYHCKKMGHNRAICPSKFPTIQTDQKVKPAITLHTHSKGTTILQTAIVTASKEDDDSKTALCRVLLDSGSQRTYVTRKIAKDLNLEILEENKLTIYTFGSNTPQEIESPVVKLILKTKTNKLLTIFANIIPLISHSVPYPHEIMKSWANKAELADDGSLEDQIHILIGNDYYFSLISDKKIHLKDNLYIVQSDFGWILSGKSNSKTDFHELMVITYFQSNVQVKFNEPDLPLLETNMKSLWDLESIGITDSPKESREEEAIKSFNATTEYTDNRYHVSWPWIHYPPDLPSNFGLAYSRLVGLLKRLDAETLSAYNNTLEDQMNKGIIEIVPREEYHTSHKDYMIHYLPHHGVKNPGKPIRIVYDASSKTKDCKSLNECLRSGPLLLEDLTGVLIRFRTHKIAMSADVEKAFLQIALQANSRDVTRFLWIQDISKPATNDNVIHLRFCRVPFGIISSPFILNAVIKHHLMQSKHENTKRAANDIYVDNLITGTEDASQAIQLYKDLKENFQDMSMNLREWSSNSEKVKQSIPDICKDTTVKILGLDWNTQNDTIQLRIKDTKFQTTKRGILKAIASVYDPCGYAVPSMLASKLFLQELWKLKFKWDSPLPKEIAEKWQMIYKDLDTIQVILPRYYLNDVCNPLQEIENELHCFTDASNKAYAAVVYIVNKKGKGFVIGKSRLVPIKDQEHLKIPRLELLAVLIGNRLLKYVDNALQINVKQHYLWTDSQIVVDWYNSNKLLSPFVARRIEEIRRNKKLILRHVPTEINPADVATRPIKSEEDKVYWIEGPDFLLQDPSDWPTTSPGEHSLLTREGLSNTEDKTKPEMLEMDTTYKATLKKANKNDQDKIEEIKTLQREHFSQVLEGKETCLKRNLGLFLDIDGIIRCQGRLKNTDWPYGQRYPILIPKDSEFTSRVIRQVHEENYHVGANHTLSILRKSFWIPQGKRQVQKIINKCLSCQKHGGGPFKLPPTPALQAERVNYSSPFTFTAVDYFGPVLIKTEDGTNKRWIALFTCLAVRAVHLEVVKDLTAEEGLLALRRMIATRGIPQLVTSDNATNFKLIAEVLSSSFCIKNEIKWRFIPQLAPWFGGFYERLIGIVKNCMKRTLEKHLLTDSQLVTMIKEIEATVNTRPLTCVDSELVHILTPSDFLSIGKCITLEGSPEEILMQGTTTKTDLLKAWKRGLKILDEFKDMFNNRYLQSLRERYNHSVQQPRVTAKIMPRIGQIVQIKGDNKNREGWKVGKIVELSKSSDGLCRVAKVKVGNKEFVRSIAHLYPLELQDNEDIEYQEDDTLEKGRCNLQNELPSPGSIPVEIEVENLDNELDTSRQEAYNIPVVDQNLVENVDETLKIRDEVNQQSQSINEPIATQEKISERPKRDAATRALEKIREWTHSLLTLL